VKILVLQLKRIGDLVLTTPALAALRRHLPDAHLALALDEATRELLPALDFVDEALVYGRAGGNGALWRKLVFSHYDVCLDFTGNDRSALFSVLSKAPRRVTFSWAQKSGMRSWFYNRFIDSSVRENHTVDHYLDLLKGVAPDITPAPMTLHLPEWAPKKAAQLLQEVGVTGDYVIVHPGSARPEKYWVPKRWAEVVAFVTNEYGLPCVLTGSRDPHEQEHIAAIKRDGAVPDLSGRLDLLTLAALAQKTRLMLSVDSAAMHFAAAFSTPQVALFGPTNPFHWRPRHERAIILAAGHPELSFALKPHHQAAAMSELSTGRVTGAIKTLL
jgi:ADP-heptose:LPS heptosyltransferase